MNTGSNFYKTWMKKISTVALYIFVIFIVSPAITSHAATVLNGVDGSSLDGASQEPSGFNTYADQVPTTQTQTTAAPQTNSAIPAQTTGVAQTPATNNTSNGVAQTQATNNTSNSSGGLINPLNTSSIQGLIQEILGYVVTIGGIFLMIMLVYVGFMFINARGNEQKLTQARNAFLYTVIGGLILLGASVLASVIASTISSL